jgi:hypothetical protein
MWWLPLEGAGFEPSVPPISSVVTHGTPARHPRPHFTAGMMMRGTEGSNPPPSTGESSANLTSSPGSRCAGHTVVESRLRFGRFISMVSGEENSTKR